MEYVYNCSTVTEGHFLKVLLSLESGSDGKSIWKGDVFDMGRVSCETVLVSKYGLDMPLSRMLSFLEKVLLKRARKKVVMIGGASFFTEVGGGCEVVGLVV